MHLLDTGAGDSHRWPHQARIATFIGDETFMLTYGDGVADVDLGELLRFHRSHGKLATVTAARPPARFGGLRLDGDRVVRVRGEAADRRGLGQRRLLRARAGCRSTTSTPTTWHSSATRSNGLRRTASSRAYRHDGFWQPMDTMRDVELLEGLWAGGKAPWRVW